MPTAKMALSLAVGSNLKMPAISFELKIRACPAIFVLDVFLSHAAFVKYKGAKKELEG